MRVGLGQSRGDAPFGPCSASPRTPRSFGAYVRRVSRRRHVLSRRDATNNVQVRAKTLA